MSVSFSGPLFDGRADRAAAVACREIEEQLGDTGVDMVRDLLSTSLRHPTGRYSSGVSAEPDGGDIAITDGGIVYGPWLEGTGSRNRDTRFKGYATFRRVAQALQGRAVALAEPVLARHVRDMG